MTSPEYKRREKLDVLSSEAACYISLKRKLNTEATLIIFTMVSTFLLCLAAFAASASAQCTYPSMIQNNVFKTNNISTWTFQTNTYQYADTTGVQLNVTCDGMNGAYYFGRYKSNMAPGMEVFTCTKYEQLVTDVFRFMDYSYAMMLSTTAFAIGSGVAATFNTACNMSSSYVVKPELRFTGVKQGSTVSGNSCPSGIGGNYNYTIDPMGANLCAGTNDKFTACSNEICFDTTNCTAAQTAFTTTSQSPLKKFQCMVEDSMMGGLMHLTVVDATNGIPGCVAYKKIGMWLRATYREGQCNDNQTETWVDMNGQTQSMYMLEACSSAAAVFPGLLSLMGVLLFNLF